MMDAVKYQVGGLIKYQCSRCDRELAHTILALMNHQPVRVRCNTCGSDRNYRSPKVAKESERTTKPRLRVAEPSPDVYQQKLQGSLMRTPKTYRFDESFEEGDVVMHPKFGRGVVTKIIPPDRMDALFPEGTKTLICKIADSNMSA